MPDRKLIYVAGYGLKNNNGRNKATLEKASALKKIVGEKNFKLYAPASFDSRLIKYACMLFFDFYLLFRLLFIGRKTIIIERQVFAPLTNTFLWIRKIKIVCEVHADPMGEIRFLQKSGIEKLLLRIIAVFEWYNWRLASAMIYINPLFKKEMDKKIAKPSISVYNGCDPDTFQIMDMKVCREKLDLRTGEKYFLMIGAIARWRGVDLLIDVFRQQSLSNYYLLIVGMSGDAYSRQILEKARGQNNIIFRDYTDIKRSVEYINAADVCLVPVNDILSAPGSPLKLYDYIACGKPVAVQSGVPGYSDEAERYHLGMTTDFRQPASASRDLIGFCSNLDLKYYRENNRKVALEQVSWLKRMEQWIDFIYLT